MAHRFTNFRFRVCPWVNPQAKPLRALRGSLALQSSRLVRLHYRADFHPALADLNKLLRYSFGGERPTQTARQALSPAGLRRG